MKKLIDIPAWIKEAKQNAKQAIRTTDKTLDHDSLEYFLSRVPAMRISAKAMENKGI